MENTQLTLLTHPDCQGHHLEGHPESPERLGVIINRIESSGMKAETDYRLASEIDPADIIRAHPSGFVQQITETAPADGSSDIVRIDQDTFMASGSLKAALLAAGAIAEATRLVLAGKTSRVFCATRPPGHHAEVAAAMGFCLFNNVAIAAEIALADSSINRVAILDFDVHHCNGTVDIFKGRPEVLVCSSFQANHYPNRYLDFANDHIVPTPLTAGAGGTEFRKAIENTWLPALTAHKPDIIFVSAGFDAHERDPLAQINLNESDYGWITQLILDAASDSAAGRVISTLEGGYDLQALADSVEAHLAAMIEHPSIAQSHHISTIT